MSTFIDDAQELQHRLTVAAKALRARDARSKAVRVGTRAGRAMLALAMVMCVAAAAAHHFKIVSSGDGVYLASGCAAVLVIALTIVAASTARVRRGQIDLAAAARRLDQYAADVHERITIAHDLSRRLASGFGALALAEGLERLRNIEAADFKRAVPTPGVAGLLSSWAMSLIVMAVGLVVMRSANTASSATPREGWTASVTPTSQPANSASAPAGSKSVERDGPRQMASAPGSGLPSSRPSAAPIATESSAAAAPTDTATAEAAANSAAAAMIAALPTPHGPTPPSPALPIPRSDSSASREAESSRSKPDRAGSQTTGAQAGGTLANGGSGSASPSEAAIPTPAAVTPPLDVRSDAPMTNDDAAAQTSGASEAPPAASASVPLRQDRSPPGSRELGQSGTDGGQGSGRGGPGDVKKTRGAGAVFLSVPLPDLVAGRLGAGPSRFTERTLPPQPSDVPTPPAAQAASRSGSENVIEHLNIAPAQTDALSRYFAAVRRPDPAPDAVAQPKPPGVNRP